MILFQQKINLSQIAIGMFALSIGTLVYLVDRPPECTYFVAASPLDISLYQILPELFGTIGNCLPDFAHVFAFIMITGGLIACGKTGYLLVSLLWFVTDILFEVGQRYSTVAAAWVPEWFQQVPFLKHVPRFFHTGTFDWLDLAAICIGAAAAYLMLRITIPKEEQRNKAPASSFLVKTRFF